MDNFWKEISQVCGPVSSRIRLILEEVGYIHSGLAHLEEAEIAEIENAVRSFPQTSERSEAEWQQLLGFRKPLRQFQFLLGERSLLKEVSRCVREHGIAKFCKKLLQQDSASKPVPRVLEQENEAVRRKVVEYYESMCSDQDSQHLLAFSSKLPSMQVRVSSFAFLYVP
ncbi:uncharacterized protein LOC128092434 [Culex pipiens pallens]|uniref:uncharacterized protein LOC128092434 n=1 Tax=Culex pipiens pallens TaxID=42434 RepID=UPI0022AA9B70|nr:uncharacterized protein LOC128092434 [Culex pipiens pallens]